MECVGLEYEPKVKVKFNRADVTVLTACSAAHYDGKCKSASMQGGLLFGISNCLSLDDADETIEVLRFRDIDLLSKITECPPVAHAEAARRLHIQFGAFIHVMNTDYERLNPVKE